MLYKANVCCMHVFIVTAIWHVMSDDSVALAEKYKKIIAYVFIVVNITLSCQYKHNNKTNAI